MSRTKNTIKNFSVAIMGQVIGLFISFIARIFFIKILGEEYLGLNGLFTNILTVLSLAELGVGEAIIYSLYKPLAEKDTRKCNMIMQLYKKLYIYIGIFILVIGIAITPILPYLIKELPDIKYINYIYILFVINTAISYWFSYKRNLIIADQNRYVATIYRYVFFAILNIVQIFYLVIFKDYIGFLILQIISTLLENILVSNKANKMYPYLKEKEKIKLDKKVKDEIVKNTKAMMMHRVGGTIVTSTDNIILSMLVGLNAVGIYSNYYMVVYALNLFFTQLYNSLIPSVGNFCVNNNDSKKYGLFKKINFLTFYMYSLSCVMLFALYNLFIEIWVGNSLLFPIEIVAVLIINFYLTGMRKSVLCFRDAEGLFDKDKWKSICEAIINIVVSIILGLKFGTIGIFIGTLISSITTCVWVEPFVLYKYSFNKNFLEYLKIYFKQMLWTVIVITIVITINSLVKYSLMIEFIKNGLIAFIIYHFVFFISFRKTDEYKYFYEEFIKKIVERMKIKKSELHNKKN